MPLEGGSVRGEGVLCPWGEDAAKKDVMIRAPTDHVDAYLVSRRAIG